MQRKTSRLGLVLFVLFFASPVAADQEFGEWSAPVNLGPVINSAFNDEAPAISSDGLRLYFTSDRTGNQDLWVARREDREADDHDVDDDWDESWGAPVNLGPPVNTSANESAPAFSRDGHRMFFVRNRPAGSGLDIWVSFREDEDDDFGWQEPVNLGAPVNTTFNDAGPGSLRVGGEEFLFITSNRPGGPTGPNIWMSVRQKDGPFGTPALVAELNSNAQDARATLRRDGREVFLFSDRAVSFGATDLWTSTREDRRDPWSAPVNLGGTVNSTSADNQPALSRDAGTLFFASNRPGGSGLLDLYMITRERDD